MTQNEEFMPTCMCTHLQGSKSQKRKVLVGSLIVKEVKRKLRTPVYY
jgi:hypothetical protein